MFGKLTYLFLALSVASCSTDTVYDRYRGIGADGWRRTDTLVFGIGGLHEAGTYYPVTGIRISNDYPYTSLTLVAERKTTPARTGAGAVAPGKKDNEKEVCPPEEDIRRDTLVYDLTDDHGRFYGPGIGCHHYALPAGSVALTAGDSLTISLYHIMRREHVSGIIDVGVSVSKRPP